MGSFIRGMGSVARRNLTSEKEKCVSFRAKKLRFYGLKGEVINGVDERACLAGAGEREGEKNGMPNKIPLSFSRQRSGQGKQAPHLLGM